MPPLPPPPAHVPFNRCSLSVHSTAPESSVVDPDPVDRHHFPDPDTDRDWHSGAVDSDLDLYPFQPVLRFRIRDPGSGAF
jgi:hypothetical protein